jgi:hypothetical protein
LLEPIGNTTIIKRVGLDEFGGDVFRSHIHHLSTTPSPKKERDASSL